MVEQFSMFENDITIPLPFPPSWDLITCVSSIIITIILLNALNRSSLPSFENTLVPLDNSFKCGIFSNKCFLELMSAAFNKS